MKIGTINVISYQDLLHKYLTAPLRFFCSSGQGGGKNNVCDTIMTIQTETGGKFVGDDFATWYHEVMMNQNMLVQWMMLFISPAVVVVYMIYHLSPNTAVYLVTNCCSTIAVLVVAAVWVVKIEKKTTKKW